MGSGSWQTGFRRLVDPKPGGTTGSEKSAKWHPPLHLLIPRPAQGAADPTRAYSSRSFFASAGVIVKRGAIGRVGLSEMIQRPHSA